MAIIFLIFILLENLVFVLAYLSVVEDEEKSYECFYEICEDYPDAYYENALCSCYDYDVLGNLIVAKQKYMK